MIFISVNIKKIIKEEVDSFDWISDIPALIEPTEDSIWFIVDRSEPYGNQPNDARIRFIVKLGGEFTEIRHGKEVKMFGMSDVNNMGDLEFYQEGDSLDTSNLQYDRDAYGIEYDDAKELIRTKYWRPWSERGVVSDINESNDFEWAKDHEVTYDVNELVPGHIYKFIPNLEIFNSGQSDHVPKWVHDYEGQKFAIMSQHPKDREIVFKPMGTAERMSYNGKYTRLSYYARVFQWGNFIEVSDKLMESNESNELDWISEVPIGIDIYKRVDILDLVPSLENALEGSRFRIDVEDDEVEISDASGLFESFRIDLVISIDEIIKLVRNTVDNDAAHISYIVRREYLELMQVLIKHFYL